ncbi:hypothetical protein MZE22_01190, partial [Escherichia coli]|nr:hypothetical protein [Escherichia coli]MCK2522568.1 hypothetical protein [Escherichia coli]
MTETIKVSESLELHAVAENHVTPLYQLICKNKTWLQQSLNWPQFVQSAYSALFDHGLASKSDQRFASIRSTG